MKRSVVRNLKLFDVTMRDGLQSLKQVLPLYKKKEMVDFIYYTYKPNAIEIGSIVSPKYIPQLENSLELYQYCLDQKYNSDLYMLTPNIHALKKAKNAGVKHFSFITSTSNSFQKKNTNKTLDETKTQFKNMYNLIDKDDKVKIYMSCVEECPIEGKKPVIDISSEIFYYFFNFSDINQLCLSDTCGTLTLDSFKEIIHELRGNIPVENISLHLHKHKHNDDIPLIIEHAKQVGIYKFDVSASKNMGGCAMTIDSKKGLPPNIHYSDVEQHYKILKNDIKF
jgi:hydroxymethylglutaryl-CoA lyase